MRKTPRSSVMLVKTLPVASWAAVTVTPGSTPPEESVTTPVITASDWACARAGENTIDTKSAPIHTIRFIKPPVGWPKLTYGRGAVNRPKSPIQRFSALKLLPLSAPSGVCANNMAMPMTRRSFVAAVGGSITVFSRSLRTTAQEPNVDFAFRQYHNQTPASSLHKRLVDMWDAVFRESGQRLVCKVFAQNNNIAGSDPAALKALVDGEIQFFTLMGGILGTLVPTAEVQQVPFAFR